MAGMAAETGSWEVTFPTISWKRENELKVAQSLNSQTHPSDKLPPAKPCLNLSKQCHQQGTKCSDIQAYGGFLPFKTEPVCVSSLMAVMTWWLFDTGLCLCSSLPSLGTTVSASSDQGSAKEKSTQHLLWDCHRQTDVMKSDSLKTHSTAFRKQSFWCPHSWPSLLLYLLVSANEWTHHETCPRP